MRSHLYCAYLGNHILEVSSICLTDAFLCSRYWELLLASLEVLQSGWVRLQLCRSAALAIKSFNILR